MKQQPHPLLGDVVRWKRPIDKSWQHGRLVFLGGNEVEVSSERNHGRHTIRRQYVQIQRYGPRGGASWEQM